MKDSDLNMDQEQNPTMKQQISNAQAEPRRNPNKLVRVAFGPDSESQAPSRDKSPAPTTGHHRSFTSLDQKLPPPTSNLGRPTSSSAGDNPVLVADDRPRLPSDRASDSGRPSAALKRARSDYGPRLGLDRAVLGDDDEDFAMRHGWQEEYTSSEYLKVLHSVSKSCPLISYSLIYYWSLMQWTLH